MSVNPVSTYRIQFNSDFTFSDLEKIIPYLHKLGVKTIYASPIFESTPRSTHGYDATDPNKINPEIGTEDQLLRISQELKKRNMLWLQDIVPNHLAYHENNRYLMDVLKNGQSSVYAPWFDILWDHPDFNGKLMVPFQGSELEKKIRSEFPDGKHYLITSWQDCDQRINYRRFFLVSGLICTNIQHDKVFDEYHSLIKKLVDLQVFDGLRVDHIDGLYDPTKYLNDLRKLAGDRSYIVVEKILGAEEHMPERWPVQGNTGYDFLTMLNNLFTNRAAEYEFTALYYDITGDDTRIEQQIREKKSFILHQYMNGELDNLVRLYKDSGLGDGAIDDEQIKSSISNYLVNCPVYRYYDNDIPVINRKEENINNSVQSFYKRCMQFTGPLMAKGVEDTLMYTYNRFAGHNEVGDSPEFFGYSVQEFHKLMQYRQQHWCYSMNATSTHDTKRGEDARARLNALTCFYDEWTSLVRGWMQQNKKFKTNGWPDSNDEYLVYQTLIGSYSLSDENNYPARLREYFQKALREAKIHSTWNEPDIEYENACFNFITKVLEENSDFRMTFIPFVEKIAFYGMYNSFGQLILKFTCPGIPDIYQGTELLDLSLVDPDNRRAVDYHARIKILDNELNFDRLLKNDRGGEAKLHLMHSLLQIRTEYAQLLTEGEYIAVNIDEKYNGHVLTFMRKHDRSAIFVSVPVTYALIESESNKVMESIERSIPKNLVKRKLLHFADLFQIIHLDLVA
jgi:maltooligosyltrehalose synthase